MGDRQRKHRNGQSRLHAITMPSKVNGSTVQRIIMEVEEKINAEVSTDITIADETLLSKQKSPFSTLGTLIDYLEELLKQQPHSAT